MRKYVPDLKPKPPSVHEETTTTANTFGSTDIYATAADDEEEEEEEADYVSAALWKTGVQEPVSFCTVKVLNFLNTKMFDIITRKFKQRGLFHIEICF